MKDKEGGGRTGQGKPSECHADLILQKEREEEEK